MPTCREHWRIKNSLNGLKDRWWDEDLHHILRPGLSACMAAIDHAAVTIFAPWREPMLYPPEKWPVVRLTTLLNNGKLFNGGRLTPDRAVLLDTTHSELVFGTR